MSDSVQSSLDLQSIREDVRDTVKMFSEKVLADLGDNLESVSYTHLTLPTN